MDYFSQFDSKLAPASAHVTVNSTFCEHTGLKACFIFQIPSHHQTLNQKATCHYVWNCVCKASLGLCHEGALAVDGPPTRVPPWVVPVLNTFTTCFVRLTRIALSAPHSQHLTVEKSEAP